jgi:hypothetical protein
MDGEKKEIPWYPKNYPINSNCPDHPGMVWEYDAGGWVCSGCLVGLDPIPINR